MKTSPNTEVWLDKVLAPALRRLASSAADQIIYLTSIGTAPLADELALEFDDAVRVLPQLVQEGVMTTEQATAIGSVNDQLEHMSGDAKASLWNINALKTAPEWHEVRKLAVAALNTLPANKLPV